MYCIIVLYVPYVYYNNVKKKKKKENNRWQAF